MNTPVSFEIAKLLKEKGFNEVCRWYMEDGISLSESNETNDYLMPNYYSAPTITEVVMWLYEKHGIWISLTHQHNKFFWSFGSYQTQEYNSPTEAYEAAIEYTLKNLI